MLDVNGSVSMTDLTLKTFDEHLSFVALAYVLI